MIAGRAKLGTFLSTLVVVLPGLAGPAHAYVRATTTTGVPVWWRSPCVAMDIYLGAPPPNMTADQYWKASQLAAQAWSYGDIACTGLSISITRNEAATADAGFDRKNVIVFRQDNWCQPATPTDPAPPCYPANALAVTTLVKNTTTGEIVDADMEINAVSFVWADLVANPAEDNGSTPDLQNTLTHELGHVIGLAHNCYSPNDGPSPWVDSTGNPEIDCRASNVPASVTDATMYPVVATSDTERRTLTPDDEQAACDIYPGSQGVCGAGSGQGCSVAGPTRPSRVWGVALACFVGLALVTLAYRRRASRRH